MRGQSEVRHGCTPLAGVESLVGEALFLYRNRPLRPVIDFDLYRRHVLRQCFIKQVSIEGIERFRVA